MAPFLSDAASRDLPLSGVGRYLLGKKRSESRDSSQSSIVTEGAKRLMLRGRGLERFPSFWFLLPYSGRAWQISTRFSRLAGSVDERAWSLVVSFTPSSAYERASRCLLACESITKLSFMLIEHTR